MIMMMTMITRFIPNHYHHCENNLRTQEAITIILVSGVASMSVIVVIVVVITINKLQLSSSLSL